MAGIQEELLDVDILVADVLVLARIAEARAVLVVVRVIRSDLEQEAAAREARRGPDCARDHLKIAKPAGKDQRLRDEIGAPEKVERGATEVLDGCREVAAAVRVQDRRHGH